METSSNKARSVLPCVTTQNVTEYQPWKLSAEASTLGLPPGEWPKTIPTILGNKQQFILSGVDEYGTHRYYQELGVLSLDVFND